MELSLGEVESLLSPEFEVWESKSVSTLWAVVVSPDCSAVLSVSKALDSGFDEESVPAAPGGFGLAARYF